MDTDVRAGTGRDGPPTLTDGVDLLHAFTAAAHARHDAEVAVVQTLGRLVRAGVIESLEGLPVDVHLAVAHSFTMAERAMLLDATDVLAVMPATMRLWTDRQISWSQVRALVAQVRRYGREVRVALDDRIGASADLVALTDADRWDWMIAEAIGDLAGPEQTERQEEQAGRESFLSVQMGLFGRSRVYGELDVPDTAIAIAAMDRRAAADQAAGLGSRPGDRTGRRNRRVSRARRRARALVGLLADSLDGHTCRTTGTQTGPAARTPRPPDSHDCGNTTGTAAMTGTAAAAMTGTAAAAMTDQGGAADTGGGRCCGGRTVKAKPLMVVHVPLDRITTSASGMLDIAVPGWLPTLSARLTDGLAADADIKAVLFHGARPLMVTRKLHAPDIPADTRLACQARDMGARDPAGRTPTSLSDLHHLTPHDHTDDPPDAPPDDGNHQRVHDPNRMAHVSPRGHHRIIHRHGWTGHLDPTDGRLTWTRGDRTITTLPWHTTLRKA